MLPFIVRGVTLTMLDPEGLCPSGVPRGLPPPGLWLRGLGTGRGLVLRDDPPYLMLFTFKRLVMIALFDDKTHKMFKTDLTNGYP